ncbi:hypothetical protein A5646_08645 [Mycobacterium sp. 1245499.0]|nr:hypothetical protein A5646_08645 [Mycobacterium sp. 1245499.0]
MTWAYAANVLDLEPRGPLPTEIYWRRRGLAIGIAVVVIGIVAAVVIAFMGNSAGAKPANADKASATDLQSVDGIGAMWARHVREGLSQLAESTITDSLN